MFHMQNHLLWWSKRSIAGYLQWCPHVICWTKIAPTLSAVAFIYSLAFDNSHIGCQIAPTPGWKMWNCLWGSKVGACQWMWILLPWTKGIAKHVILFRKYHVMFAWSDLYHFVSLSYLDNENRHSFLGGVEVCHCCPLVELQHDYLIHCPLFKVNPSVHVLSHF